MNPKKDFDRLAKLGCNVFRLTSELTPMDKGWNKPDFVFETQYREGQNYGIVGGSTHTDKEGKTGKLVFADLDIKEKVPDGNGGFVERVNPEAAAKLEDVKSSVRDRDYYFADTKTGGQHMGVLSNEDLQQGVALYEHQDCPKLRVDLRTQDGYVVAIAPGYTITKIPEIFDRVIPEFEYFMMSFSFSKTGNASGKHSGSLSFEFKQKARDAMVNMDTKYFPELGGERVSTHDVISFWTMSGRALGISKNVTIEKIIILLGQITTSKNNEVTEAEIEKMYDKEYEGFDAPEKDKDIMKSDEKVKLDDYAIANRLMELYHFKTLEKTKEILFWKNGLYRDGGEEVISKRSRKIADGVRKNDIAEIKAIIQDETGYLPRSKFDKESYIVNMTNCTFNLLTGEEGKHSPNYLSRIQVPVYYDAAATCPRFDKFLDSSLGGDEKKIRTILEMIALCFIKDSGLLEKAFMNTGRGSNGKTILFGIIIAMLGMENVTAKTLQSIEKNRFALSGLEGKLANICSEIGGKGIVSTDHIKNVISGDMLEGEKKGLDAYVFVPCATLIFSANEIPEVSDGSDGFARKFELILWEIQFYGADRDYSVKTIKKSPSELSGIFNKLVPIAKELLQTQKLKYESTVEDVKLEWLQKSDSVQRFIDGNIIRKTDGACSVASVAARYEKFCKEKSLTPVSAQKFNKKMLKNGFEKTQKRIRGVGNVKAWIGFELRDEPKPKPKQTNL